MDRERTVAMCRSELHTLVWFECIKRKKKITIDSLDWYKVIFIGQ